MNSNNLDQIITAADVVKILKKDTDSGIPRLDRIKKNNPELFEALGSPEKVSKEVASKLMSWSSQNYSAEIYEAEKELKAYINLLDLLISEFDRIELILPSVKAFKYKNFSKLLEKTSNNSKIRNRINNLKLICELLSKKNVKKETKHRLTNYLIKEIYDQKSFFLILNKSLEKFEGEYFILGLLLYDIPATEEANTLNFLKEIM